MINRLKVLAIGWYGASNVGDELLLGVMQGWLRELDADLVVVSMNPEYTKRVYGVESVDFHNLGELARVMADCDLFLMGGGGIFQDHHPFNIHALYDPLASDIAQYARPFYLARQFFIPTVILGHGVGPLNSRSSQMVAKDVFSLADFVSVRDDHSAQLLKDIGVDRELTVAADPGWFAMRSFVKLTRDSPRFDGVARIKRLALIVRPWSKEPGWDGRLIAALNRSLPQGWTCVWFAFQHAIDDSKVESDARFLRQLATGLDARIESEILDCVVVEETVRAIADCDAALSMRLHGSIIALSLGVPSAFLEYDEKMIQAHQMAQVPDELRLPLCATDDAYESLISRLVSEEDPWKMDFSVLTHLQQSAARHQDVLALAVRSVDRLKEAPREWSGRDFDWLATWMEELIWRQRSAQSSSDRAHSLLEYRDSQLHELNQSLAGALKDMDELRHALDEKTEISVSQSQLIEDLTAKNEACQLKILERDAQLSRSASEIFALKDDRVGCREQLRDSENAIAEMTRSIDILKAESGAKDMHLIDVEMRLAHLVQEVCNLESGLTSQRVYIEEKEVHVAQLAQEIEVLRVELESKNAYIAEKEVHVATLMQDLQKKNRNIGVVMQEYLRARVSNVQRAVYLLQNGGPRALMSAWRRKRYIRAAVERNQGEMAVASALAVEVTPSDFFYSAAKLRDEEFVVFSTLPFSAAGGFHRAAQLAKAALGAGHRVVYVTSASGNDASQGIAGMRHFLLADLTVAELFSCLSERAVIVNFVVDEVVRPYLQYAKARGVVAYLDFQEIDSGKQIANVSYLPSLVEAVSAVVVSGEVSRSRLSGLSAVRTLALPAAASHVVFDVYKQYNMPGEFGGDSRQKFLVLMPEASKAVDWDYLIKSAKLNTEWSFYLLGISLPAGDRPRNLIELPDGCLANVSAFVAHCDAVFVPVCSAFVATDEASLGVYAGAFFNKHVVSSQLFEIPHLRNFLHALDVRRFDDLPRQFGPILNNDLFVARNSWLSRIESLAPSAPRNDVSVVILIHNNAKIIGRCLDTLLAHCTAFIREVIVVDNASSDGGAEVVERDFPQVKLVRNPENGCSSGRNLGVKHATGKYLVFFDSDQWFTGGAGFAEALAILENHANVGVIGWNAGWFDATRTDLGGMIADYCPNRAMNASAIRNGYRSDIGFLGTSGFFMRRVTFDAIDGFDTYYDPTCFEDTDLCFQVRVLGMEVSYRDLSGIRHQPHQTTGADSGSDKYKALFLRNAEYFKKKWKDYPQFLVDYDFNAQ